jgi:hypothetical protein
VTGGGRARGDGRYLLLRQVGVRVGSAAMTGGVGHHRRIRGDGDGLALEAMPEAALVRWA